MKIQEIDKYQIILHENTVSLADAVKGVSIAGNRITIKENTKLDKPIEIKFESYSQSKNIEITVEQGSQLQVIENFKLNSTNQEYSMNYVLKEGAELKLYKIITDNFHDALMEKLNIKAEDRAKVQLYVMSFGGERIKNEIELELNGEEIDAQIYGLSAISKKQIVDNYITVKHNKPNSKSYQLFKGIYDGNSQGSFIATVEVAKDAQKTMALQENHAILLSNDAKIKTQPHLKIFADDVKCSHGATVGQLDDNAFFYLRTRGIPEKDARSILLQSFANEVLTKISIPLLDNSL